MEEERQRAAQASSGANAVPLRSRDEHPVRSAKRLTSPERWEIKQLISSGVIDASEYPDLDEDFSNPVARAEVEEELDVEIREEEPAFLAGQTKRTLDLSPVKIIKAPDGSLNRAAIGGAALAKERRELRQQEVNERADSEARDFSAPWLDPMAKDSEKVFAQDLRGNLRDQKAGEVPQWRESTFNKATTYGEITTLSIQEQRRNLPIYKLRDPLLQAIGDVTSSPLKMNSDANSYYSIKFSWSLEILGLAKRRKWFNTLLKRGTPTKVALAAHNRAVLQPCLWQSVSQKKLAVVLVKRSAIPSVLRIALVQRRKSST